MTDYEKYIIARWCYSIGYEYITNSEYTILHRAMKATYPDDIYVNQSWSSDPCPVALLKKYNLEQYIEKVIYLDKTESIESLCNLYEVHKEFHDMTHARVSMKEDGWNVQANYFRGVFVSIHLRGRSTDFVDVGQLQNAVPTTIPDKGKVRIPLEATITDDVFAYCVQKYGSESQRAAVSTLLANKEDTHLLTLHATALQSETNYPDVYATLHSWGFKTPPFREVTDYDSLLKAMEELSDYRYEYGIPTDGLVIDTGIKVRAARVFAWEEPIYRSYVEGYEEQANAYRISIGIKIFPIKLDNSTQRNVPCTNIARLVKNNLCPGAPVAFRFVSGTIADLDEENTKLLQQEYSGRYEEYRQEIKENEAQKALALQQKLMQHNLAASAFNI